MSNYNGIERRHENIALREILENFEDKLKSVEDAYNKISYLIYGNGTPGLAEQVRNLQDSVKSIQTSLEESRKESKEVRKQIFIGVVVAIIVAVINVVISLVKLKIIVQ